MANNKHSVNKKGISNEFLSKQDFDCLITEAENGLFKPAGNFEEFKKEVLAVWKKRHSK